ncbi:MAG: IS21 family transposase [Bacteroidota bacterium]
MIHQIKALYNNGQGSSILTIAKQLGLSKNTVRKYLSMDEAAIEKLQSDRSRQKKLDEYQDYIVHLLETFPKLTAAKIQRQLEDRVGSLNIAARTFRRYINQLRQSVMVAQPRYYEPVLDHIPGVQCQVDPGELRNVVIDGVLTTIYFVVFVLSFSRLMYVGVSRRPLDTGIFIQLHDQAFRFFDGCPQECVYDQTKMVVLDDCFRELTVNQDFARYATMAGFRIRACKAYDPESKGLVEAGVRYVKQDGLYGEHFENWPCLETHMQNWLIKVSNQRLHGTTGQQPQVMYDQQERAKMRPYLTPAFLSQNTMGAPRLVDKTGLISWQSNKYSIPMRWQRGQVTVSVSSDNELCIHDPKTGQKIASHVLHQGKGQIIKNNDHYRDKSQQISDLEQSIQQTLGKTTGQRLCLAIKNNDVRHYKDQLQGLKQQTDRLNKLPKNQLEHLLKKDTLKVSYILDYLNAWENNPQRVQNLGETPPKASEASTLLANYQALTQKGGRHVYH